MTHFVRARHPEQKEERRAQLLSTARKWLEDGVELRDLSLNDLARRAGMAKSNVYRYFESREALLLAVLWEEWTAWFDDVKATRQKGARGRPALDALVTRLSRSLSDRPLLCKLMASLPTVVEQNLTDETLRDFKLRSLLLLGDVAAYLHEVAPILDQENYVQLMNDGAAVIAGLYPLAHPAPAVARVLAADDMGAMRHDFEEDLTRMLLALARDRAR